MPIQTVFGNINLSAFKPLNIAFFKTSTVHFIPRFVPIERLSVVSPKLFGLLNTFFIYLFVFFKRTYCMIWHNNSLNSMLIFLISSICKLYKLFHILTQDL